VGRVDQGDGRRLTGGVRGEPDAVEVARPVREAGRRDGPAEMLAPRSGSTSLAGQIAGNGGGGGGGHGVSLLVIDDGWGACRPAWSVINR